ncbi:MAG TPA: hypothetical protein DCR14_10375 [Acidimicrobiaceae bacterium]|nr:hypothetical protein [Acidimicrobiaceae bacterium]
MQNEDPRVARTRAAVLGTAADLVVEGGPSALTVDAVVARSGVAKSTIYRHWPTRDDLVRDVFQFCAPTPASPEPDLGFEQALRLFLHDLVAQLSDPKWARMLPALLALRAYEPTMSAVEEQVDAMHRQVTEELFARGEREGLFGRDLDHQRAIALLIGPLIFALITGETPLTTDLADASLHAFMAGLRARP